MSLYYSSSSDEEEEGEPTFGSSDLVSSPLILAESNYKNTAYKQRSARNVSAMDVLMTALRRSLVMCSVGGEGDGGMEIGWPTEVKHVAHVTFDRFDGFLGLPEDLEPEVPCRVPSASVCVFGVSANSMQCTYDSRGNSVPTILLSMQRHLYLRGGLQAEGIFRINAENGQEIQVREQLNTGLVPEGIDLHCLAGLIKAWFRELPTGVLDSLTPDQVMRCNSEEEFSQLVRLLPPTEAALLDWAINLMADVVEHEQYNKMNARNIAMVFAPNMTQMADPLTALIHAVQVMNFLKTLIVKTIREREEALVKSMDLLSFSQSPTHSEENKNASQVEQKSRKLDYPMFNTYSFNKFLFRNNQDIDCDPEDGFHSFDKKSDVEDHDFVSVKNSSAKCDVNSIRDEVIVLDRFSFREGIRKFCQHPVFQLSKLNRKNEDVGIVCSDKEEKGATCI